MTEAPRTLFRVERTDNALIIVPGGDLVGFQQHEIIKETDSLVSDIKAAVITGVIFDGCESSYLSSAIIGAMIRIWEAAADQGGKFVTCNLGDDALSAIVATRLDTKWPNYDTRAEALKALG